MSLFSGLFKSNSSEGGGIFAQSSQFKQQQQQQPAEPTTAAGPQHGVHVHEKKFKKKRKSAADADADAAPAAVQVAHMAAATAGGEAAGQDAQQRKSKKQKLLLETKPSPQQHNHRAEVNAKLDKQPRQQLKAQQAAAAAAAAAASAAAAHPGSALPEVHDAAGSLASAPAKGKKGKRDHKPHKQPTQQPRTSSGPDPDSSKPKHTATAAAPDGPTAASPAAAATAMAAEEPSDTEADAQTAAEKLERTLFVGNLPVTIKPKQLKQLFSEFGAVESVRLRSVPLDMEAKKKLPRKAAVIRGMVTGERGGAKAYVVFEQQQSVQPALAKNMTVMDGHHIRVDRAAQPAAAAAATGKATEAAAGRSSVLYEPSRSVFIGNLDFNVSEEQLIEVFANMEVPHVTLPEGQDTHVEAVRVVRDPNTNMGIGVAYVLFKTKAAARAALELNSRPLNKRPMRISRITKQAAGGRAGPAGGVRSTQQGKGSGKRAGSAGPSHRVGRNGPGGAVLGVQQGGVQKRLGRPGAAAAAGDWQGLRTKGKGAKLRGPKAAGAAGGGRATNPVRAGAPKDRKAGGKAKGRAAGAKGQKGKRPAVAARKAAQRVKAAAAKK